MNGFTFGASRAGFSGLVVAAAFVVAGTVSAPASSHAASTSNAASSSASRAGSGPLPPARLSPEPVERLFGTEIRRIPTTRRVVALTFNAAWDDTGVDTALTVLRARKVPATFFLTGQFAGRHPSAARAMAAEHGIGNHSYSHPQFGGLTSREAAQEVLRADRAIRRASGVAPLPFFRFPYSATTPRGIADANGLGFADIEFTADTNGYLGTDGGMTVQKAVDRAMDALTPGEIVQMHVGTSDGHGPALDVLALPRIIDAIHARGYQVIDLHSFLSA